MWKNPLLRLLLLLLLLFSLSCRRERPQAKRLFLNEPLCLEVKAEGYAKGLLKDLCRYARLFGCPIVSKENSSFMLSGKVEVIDEGKKETGYAFSVRADLRLVETDTGKVVERWNTGTTTFVRSERIRAQRQAVAGGARMLARLIFFFGETLGQEDVRNLIAQLNIQRLEPYSLSFNEVVDQLAKVGLRAVPYLIWSLAFDHRKVELVGDIPGFKPEDAQKIKVHHVMNYALERILKKEAFLDVDSPPEEVETFVRGWTREWHRYCAGYLGEKRLFELLKSGSEVFIRPPRASPLKFKEQKEAHFSSGEGRGKKK